MPAAQPVSNSPAKPTGGQVQLGPLLVKWLLIEVCWSTPRRESSAPRPNYLVAALIPWLALIATGPIALVAGLAFIATRSIALVARLSIIAFLAWWLCGQRDAGQTQDQTEYYPLLPAP